MQINSEITLSYLTGCHLEVASKAVWHGKILKSKFNVIK